MTQKFLNLDEIASPEKITIQIDGAKHAFKEMTVADFAWVQKKMATISKVEEGDEAKFVSDTIDVIDRQFPTIGRERIEQFTIWQLKTLTDFISDLSLKGAEETIAESEVISEEGNAE